MDSNTAERRRGGHVGHAYKYIYDDEKEARDELDQQLNPEYTPLIALD
jgi:hypothetical protein